ncbi:hypothetical protein KIW84_021833 [Lathyrus oleraceus]|uniref:Uncharacterized protein n=1 Tax=Pisum sativum TaxID=3888 RepID=A0A9D5B4H9_PEA|nr:hypothetical protein KIW84_021833 [Pisum sativum]
MAVRDLAVCHYGNDEKNESMEKLSVRSSAVFDKIMLMWRTYGHIVKSYIGNALHILNQMTDSQMISFALHRLKYSSLLLAAFPSLIRKYLKVALHFWGTGGGAFPVAS